MTLAVISISFFTLRFIWMMMNSDKLKAKWIKITPHLNDTLLLTLGIIMMVQYRINPFEQLWLGEKLLAILAYIFTGYYTFKMARNRAMQIFGYLGAMGWIMLIVRLAMTKQPLFLI